MKTSPFSRRAAVYRQRLLLAVLVLLACGVMPLAFVAGVPAAGVALGILLLVLALARLVLPVDALGALVVRMRLIDVGILTLLGGGILALSLTSPNL